MDVSYRKVEKRNRLPVSCEPCRTRKLKCNRGLPCDTCVRRNKVSACIYASNAARTKPGQNKQRDLKDRLNSLENLVSSLLTGDAIIQPGLPTPSQSLAGSDGAVLPLDDSFRENRDLGSGLGSVSGREDALTPETPHLQETGDGQRNYIDPNHWLSILDDIKEIREHVSVTSQPLPRKERTQDVDRAITDPSFLFPATYNSNFDNILSALPAQPVCDRLLSWYFNSRFMILGIVHPVKFQEEYAAFWESPSTTPMVWTALLFSILAISISLRQVTGIIEAEGSMPSIKTLQQKTVQCLLLGRYSIANAHAIEALILHLQTCFFSNDFTSFDPWLGMGTIIRLAFRMGYQRDPANLAGISPFDGEMRRRVWLNIFQMDALMSFQMGFPSMIPTEFCDAEVPRNLEYLDLNTDMTDLPPSRPLSENTPVLYIIVKASVMAVFKKIVAHTQSLSVQPYDVTLALDKEMNQVYGIIPEILKRRSVNRSLIDHAVLIWQRCTIEVLFLKGIIVLHRRYISYEPRSSKFEHSRRACVEAAIDILSRQADLHEACEPGGRLYDERWMIFALPAHDFLLAAMVICLDLSVRLRTQSSTSLEHVDLQDLANREYRALQKSQSIWARNSAASPDAHIAALALDLMIKKVADNGFGLLPMHDASFEETESLFNSELPYASSMSQMIDGSEIIDWSLLDQYLQNMDTSIPETAT